MAKTFNYMNVVALVKGPETFVFLFDKTSESYRAVIKTVLEFQSDPELSINQADVDTLLQRIEVLKDESPE